MLEELLDSASVGGRRAMTDLQKAAEFFDGDDDRGILLEGLAAIAAGLVDAINGVTVPDEGCGPRCDCGSCDDTDLEHGLPDRTERCEHCNTALTLRGCGVCHAPVCCPKCCAETNAVPEERLPESHQRRCASCSHPVVPGKEDPVRCYTCHASINGDPANGSEYKAIWMPLALRTYDAPPEDGLSRKGPNTDPISGISLTLSDPEGHPAKPPSPRYRGGVGTASPPSISTTRTYSMRTKTT